jgi:hypothetical protein
MRNSVTPENMHIPSVCMGIITGLAQKNMALVELVSISTVSF